MEHFKRNKLRISIQDHIIHADFAQMDWWFVVSLSFLAMPRVDWILFIVHTFFCAYAMAHFFQTCILYTLFSFALIYQRDEKKKFHFCQWISTRMFATFFIFLVVVLATFACTTIIWSTHGAYFNVKKWRQFLKWNDNDIAALHKGEHIIFSSVFHFPSFFFPSASSRFIHSSQEDWTWFYFFFFFFLVSLCFLIACEQKIQSNFCRALNTHVFVNILVWLLFEALARRCSVFIVRVIMKKKKIRVKRKEQDKIRACSLRDTTKQQSYFHDFSLKTHDVLLFFTLFLFPAFSSHSFYPTYHWLSERKKNLINESNRNCSLCFAWKI